MEEIDGNAVAEEIEDELPRFTKSPHLHLVLAGNNKASETFVKEKQDACKRLDFESSVKKFPGDVSEEKVLEHIKQVNRNGSIHGVIVQLPLPLHIDENTVFRKLDPEKDVDGLTPENIGKLLRGDETVVPCAVSAIEKILEHEDIELEGKNVTIINNTSLIGRPLSMRLTQKEATVTVCHEKTRDLETHTENSDIIITATGQPEVIKKDSVKEDTVVIDAGYSFVDGNIVQESENIEEKASKMSPVPGGVGPVTVAMTLKNLVKCFRNQS